MRLFFAQDTSPFPSWGASINLLTMTTAAREAQTSELLLFFVRHGPDPAREIRTSTNIWPGDQRGCGASAR